MAPSLTRIASIPPTACTATTASTITMPILITNWNRSVTSTPHNPESVEIADVRAIMPTKILQLVFGVSKGEALWIVVGLIALTSASSQRSGLWGGLGTLSVHFTRNAGMA